MNGYAVVILCALLIDFILNLVADSLNLRTLDGELPGEFHGFYNAAAYKKSQDYTRAGIRMGIFQHFFMLAVTLLFWFSGGFNYLDMLVRSLNLHAIVNGLIFSAAVLLIRFLLTLPFSLFATFVIEERFGFNKTTPSTFVADILKGFALTLVIGGPLLAGILAFFQYTGALAWVYCWIVVSLAALFIQFVAPAWILPLFYKFKPIEDGVLKEKIRDYCQSVQFSILETYIIDGSRRSGKTNAFFTGMGKNKRIALFDTLIDKHPVPELVAILAHEIGHYKKHHIIQGTIISIIHMGCMFYLLSLFLSETGLFDAFYMEQMSVYTGFIFFGMLYTPVELFLSLFLNMLSRRNEYQADHFAAETTKAPESMILALKKLAVHNLSNLMPHPFYVFLHYSHPPLLARIQALHGDRR